MMTVRLNPSTKSKLQGSFEVLKTPYRWRAVTSHFSDEVPERSHLSNVHVVPFVGESCVLLHTVESGWATPGGTLLEGEAVADAVIRELGEEIGGEPVRFELFGAWESVTTAKEPYRPWLPHPEFAIALGWADIHIVGSATSDGGVEQETVQEVLILSVEQAAKRLELEGKPHLAALYRVAAEVRKADKEATLSS